MFDFSNLEAIKKKLSVLKAQIIFIYDSVRNNPNGDPITGMPRMDESTDRVLISDVRIKRYARDYMLFQNLIGANNEVYLKEVDRDELSKIVTDKKELKKMSGSAAQIAILQKKYGITDAKELMLKAVDCRIFGGISTAENNTAQITGPVQFMNLNQALNRVPIRPNQNTTVFESSMDKEQGSIGTNGLIDFSLNQIIGEVNPFLALKTGLVEKECSWFISSLFDAVNNVTSKSKFGQTSRLLLKINLKNPVHKLADLSEKVQIKDPNNTSYRSVSEVIWDFSRLVKVVAGDHVENVQYRAEDSVEAIFLEQMSSVKDKLVKF